MTRDELIEQACLIHTLAGTATTWAFLEQFWANQRDDWWAAILAVVQHDKSWNWADIK